MVKQEASSAYVEFDDDDLALFADRMIQQGVMPNRCRRIWIHTHPGNSPSPSGKDESTFNEHFEHFDWSVMFIMAQDGTCYSRLRVRTELSRQNGQRPIWVDSVMKVMYMDPLDTGSEESVTMVYDKPGWLEEMRANVKTRSYQGQSYFKGSDSVVVTTGGSMGKPLGPNLANMTQYEYKKHVGMDEKTKCCQWGVRMQLRGTCSTLDRLVVGGKVYDDKGAETDIVLQGSYVRAADWELEQGRMDIRRNLDTALAIWAEDQDDLLQMQDKRKSLPDYLFNMDGSVDWAFLTRRYKLTPEEVTVCSSLPWTDQLSEMQVMEDEFIAKYKSPIVPPGSNTPPQGASDDNSFGYDNYGG